jgi:hypothetical protein
MLLMYISALFHTIASIDMKAATRGLGHPVPRLPPGVHGGKMMVRRTRMQAQRRKAAGERARAPRSDKAGERAMPERGPAVSAEARRLLAECCAFFRADRHRDAGPGKIRSHDIAVAEAEISAIIRKFCGSGHARGG